MVIINGRPKLTATLVLALISLFLLFAAACLYGKDEAISYLPRNEDMQSISKDYPGSSVKKLREVLCSAAEDLFNDYRTCIKCVTDKQAYCPDCCLTSTYHNKAIRCTPQDNPIYRCCEMPFDALECSSLIDCPQADWNRVCRNAHSMATENHCQRLGCASLEPDGNCRKVGADWLCEKDNLEPKFKGCPCREPAKNACPAGSNNKCVPPCDKLASYYITIPVESPQCPSSSSFLGPKTCYQYNPTAEFADCINKCLAYADEYDTCRNRQDCCKREVCGNLNPPGYQNCDLDVCQARIDESSLCERYTLADCSRILKDAEDCVSGGFFAGGCSKCFREIDSEFNYRFIAKSRESMTVIWQMSTTPYDITNPSQPTYVANSGTYFFSKVMVFEITPAGAEVKVHESMLHQKSLEAAFSIFCATQIPDNVLQPGNSYVIRAYYFLPQLAGVDLEVHLNNIRLIMVRTRQ